MKIPRNRPGRRLIKDSGPSPIDIFIGKRLRQRRLELALSQTAIGHELGISFQAVQKYEDGSNRVAASTLYRLCQILDVGASYFFKGYKDKGHL